MLPFTHQQFVFVFALYNGVIWPLQWVAQAVGIGMLALLWRPSRDRGRISILLLAAMWLWTGLAYHVVFFSLINPAATTFGAFFVLEGLLLAEAGLRGRLVFGEASGLSRGLGWALLVYSVVGYPALGLMLGERVLELPAFGLTPCPVVLTTLGMLLLAAGPATAVALRHPCGLGADRRQRRRAASRAAGLAVASLALLAGDRRDPRASAGADRGGPCAPLVSSHASPLLQRPHSPPSSRSAR